jgi:hypothetical protein
MNNRLAVIVLSATMLLAGCTMWHEHEVSNFNDATGGEGLERSFWKQVKNKRWNEVERHLASNYVLVTPQEGRLDKAAAFAHFQQLQLDEFMLGDLQAELNTDTLIVTYAITMRAKFAGQPVPADPVRMMTVWQKQKAGWLAIAHSVQGAESPQPEKK